jgi:archaetidylinositol phosphate synthase
VQDVVEKRDTGRLVPFEQWMARAGARFVPLTMSANQVTLCSGLFGVSAGAAFALASFDRRLFLVGALCMLLHWAGDNVDGQIARTRNLCSASGRFLDIFFDAITFAAVGLGFAASGAAHFTIVATATVLCMLQYVLTMLWMALTRIWPFPAFGPAEACLTAILLGVAMFLLPPHLLTLFGLSLSLVDVLFAIMIPLSLIEIGRSAFALFRELGRQDTGSDPEASR